MSVIVIEDWMIRDEKLSGVKLLAFALIYGCTQKGDGCWYGGYEKLAERVGVTPRSVIKSVNELVESGRIEKCDGEIDGKVRKILRSTLHYEQNSYEQNSYEKNSYENSSQEGVKKVHIKGEQNSYPSNNKEKEKKNNIPDFSPEVEELYALYPTRCPKSGRGTDKGRESKKIIVRLLKNHTSQEIAAAIHAYLEDCDKTNTFIKNFDSLLHRIERGDISGDLFQSNPNQQRQEQPMYSSIEEWEAAKKANKK